MFIGEYTIQVLGYFQDYTLKLFINNFIDVFLFSLYQFFLNKKFKALKPVKTLNTTFVVVILL